MTAAATATATARNSSDLGRRRRREAAPAPRPRPISRKSTSSGGTSSPRLMPSILPRVRPLRQGSAAHRCTGRALQHGRLPDSVTRSASPGPTPTQAPYGAARSDRYECQPRNAGPTAPRHRLPAASLVTPACPPAASPAPLCLSAGVRHQYWDAGPLRSATATLSALLATETVTVTCPPCRRRAAVSHAVGDRLTDQQHRHIEARCPVPSTPPTNANCSARASTVTLSRTQVPRSVMPSLSRPGQLCGPYGRCGCPGPGRLRSVEVVSWLTHLTSDAKPQSLS